MRLAPELKRSTISDVLRGKSAPTIEFVVAFVDACHKFSADGMALDPLQVDLALWRERWMIFQRDLGAARRSATPPDRQLDGLAEIEGGILIAAGNVPLVRDIGDLRLIGVHHAVSPNDDAAPSPAPYVKRDIDQQLAKALARPGFVLLVGDSTAGKTRSAFEAALRVVPDHFLVAPQDRESVRAAIGFAAARPQAVLWLDDLERFLGRDGFTRARVAQLLMGTGHHRIILATMRATEAARYSGSASDPPGYASQAALDTLAQASRFHLDRMLTAAERSRVQQAAADSRQIASAVPHLATLGLAEYLAAGPRLYAAWKESRAVGTHRLGAALVTAAIDCHHAGLTGPLPQELLGAVAELHLASEHGTGAEPPAEAWAWASRAMAGMPALLTRTTTGDRFVVFDYLVDVTQRHQQPSNFPADTVLALVSEYASLDDLMRIAVAAFDHGRFQAAADAYHRAYQTVLHSHGGRHPTALDTRDRHAFVLRRLGRLPEAIAEHREVVVIRKETLGSGHPDTLLSQNNLGAALYQNGDWHEAEAEFTAVLARRLRVLGPADPQTLRSHSNHATVLYDLGRWREARDAAALALHGRARLLGDRHPHTLISRNNYGLILHAMGQLDQALAEHNTALQHRTEILGPEHPDTLESSHNRASVLYSQQLFAKAEEEHKAVFQGRLTRLGPAHPDTVDAASRHALGLSANGRLIEAQTQAEQFLETAITYLGERHPYTLDIRNTLGIVLARSHDYTNAIAQHEMAATGYASKLGPRHPYTLKALYYQAIAETGSGRDRIAQERLAGVLGVQQEELGPSHPDTQITQAALTRTIGKPPAGHR
jgi:tetratricopeptide (TPR) repeat protein